MPEIIGKPGCSIWIPIPVPLIALSEIWTLEAFAYTPTFVAWTIVLLETKLDDRRNTKPAPAWMTLLLMMSGELSVAEIARSARSNVDQETEPDELALNWMPPHGNTEAVLFAVLGSKSLPFAVAVLLKAPAAVIVAVTVTITVCVLARGEPKVQGRESQ